MNARANIGGTQRLRSNATDKDFEDIQMLRSLAATHYTFGRFDTSAKLLNLALWIDPHDQNLLELAAIVASRRGQYQRCIELL